MLSFPPNNCIDFLKEIAFGFIGFTNGLLRWPSLKESACWCRRCRRHEFDPWVGKILWIRKWQPTPVFLPGKFHGQRRLAGYTVHGVAKSQTQLSTHTLLYYYMNYSLFPLFLLALALIRSSFSGFWWSFMSDLFPTMSV